MCKTEDNWVLILFEPLTSWVTFSKFLNMSGLQILFENKGVQDTSCAPGGPRCIFTKVVESGPAAGFPHPTSTKAALLPSGSFFCFPNKILFGKNFDTKNN